MHDEPALAALAEAFDEALQVASKPSPCTRDHTDAHKLYLKLVGPMDIYRYGLYSRERVLDEIEKLLTAHRNDPVNVTSSLLAGR